jgi:hypothetical protein
VRGEKRGRRTGKLQGSHTRRVLENTRERERGEGRGRGTGRGGGLAGSDANSAFRTNNKQTRKDRTTSADSYSQRETMNRIHNGAMSFTTPRKYAFHNDKESQRERERGRERLLFFSSFSLCDTLSLCLSVRFQL